MTLPKSPSTLACVLLAGLFLATPALAEKPEHGGKGKDKHGQKHEKRGPAKRVQEKHSHEKHTHEKKADGYDHHDSDSHVDVSLNMYFGDRQRDVIREYYTQEFRGGHCPPGLSKNRNGCAPPGQAKKWNIGHRLPSDVVYYDLPPSIVIELGTPPAGYKYVRVAKDILLIAVGTSMVMDAIHDLSHL